MKEQQTSFRHSQKKTTNYLQALTNNGTRKNYAVNLLNTVWYNYTRALSVNS